MGLEYWLLPVNVVPAAIVAALVVPAAQAAISARIASRMLRLLVAVAALLAWTVIVAGISFGHPFGSVEGFLYLTFASAFYAIGVLIPWLAQTIYCTLASRPRWWAASAMAFGIVVLAVVFSVVAGVWLGAATG